MLRQKVMRKQGDEKEAKLHHQLNNAVLADGQRPEPKINY